MAKFKVGDKVKILDGSKIKDYEGSWVDSMEKYINKVFTIRMIDEKNGTEPRYLMKEIPYIWDERGLELITKQESKHKFKVGDKIIGNKKASDRYGFTREGWIGRVTKVFDTPRFGDDFRAIGPLGNINKEFGLEEEYFDLYTEPQKIVITTDGKITIAALYNGKKRIKDAKAVCAPNNKFNFEYGASLALDRLTGFIRGSVDQTLDKTLYSDFEEVKFDWDGFKAGKFNVIVNRKNIDHFLKKCDEHKIKWTTVKATKFNPIKDLDDAPPIIKFLVDAEQTEKCDLEVENGKLKYSFKLDMRDETVIYD